MQDEISLLLQDTSPVDHSLLIGIGAFSKHTTEKVKLDQVLFELRKCLKESVLIDSVAELYRKNYIKCYGLYEFVSLTEKGLYLSNFFYKK